MNVSNASALRDILSPVSTPHLWAAAVLLYLLLLFPPIVFLFQGLPIRRKDVLDNFDRAAAQAYFEAFHPTTEIKEEAYKETLEEYYNEQFGRWRFLIPLILFLALAAVFTCWVTLSVQALLLPGKAMPGHLPAVAIAALMGSYMWILSDEIGSCYSADINPTDFYWWCFRCAIAIPTGFALKPIFSPGVALPVVFLLGAFPTSTLMRLFRRLAAQKLGFADADDNQISELQSLQGINVRNAERFLDERIDTILRLAYCDPIKLTMRTGLSYSYIVDCTCQALLWVYVEANGAKLRPWGLRSAYEVLDLFLSLFDDDQAERDRAAKVIIEAAAGLATTTAGMENIVRQVALDPYTRFLYLSWFSQRIGLNAAQMQILRFQR